MKNKKSINAKDFTTVNVQRNPESYKNTRYMNNHFKQS